MVIYQSAVSIPLEQGGVFRLLFMGLTKSISHVSIPLEQGGVFRPGDIPNYEDEYSLNPFRAGRCLSTA